MNYVTNKNMELISNGEDYLLKDRLDGSFIKFTKDELKVYEKFSNANTTEGLNEFENAIFSVFREMRVILAEGEEFKKQKEKFSLFNIRLKEWDTENLLNKISGLNTIIFNKFVQYIATSAILLSGILMISLYKNGVDFFDLHFYEISSGQEIFIIYALSILTLAIHEFSHALTMIQYGFKMKNMGVKLYFFQILVYCDLSELYETNKKSEKIKVYMAGTIAQIVISAVAIIIFSILFYGFGLRFDFILMFSIMNLLGAALNIVPFVKFDGYWILTTILNQYNLDKRALSEVIGLFKFDRKRNFKLVAFGVVSLFFKVYLVASTVYLCGELMH